MKTVERLLEETGMTIDELAEKARIPLQRMEAIGTGRWLPSPSDREKIAAVFNLPITEISWEHTMCPRNIRYHREGFKEFF